MKKIVIGLLALILVSASNTFADDVSIDSNGNVKTGVSNANAELEVTGASGEGGILGSASGTGASGVYGINTTYGNYGILGYDNYGVFGYSSGGWAGYFQGNARVTGNLTIDGSILGPVIGDITEVIAGTGLTGGAASGNATLNADTSYLQRRVSSLCTVGSSIRAINQDGSVLCQTDNVGIASESDPKVGSNTTNYIPKWNGSALVTGSIFDNGNIGIGTSSPSQKLTVAGTIKSIIGGIEFPDGTIQSSAIIAPPSQNPHTNTITTVDSEGRDTSITIGTDGLPVISYMDMTDNVLNVVKCGNASCSSGNTITTVDSTGIVGYDTSITIGTDGLPVISYFNETNFDLKVAKCGNASCSSGNTITTVDSAGWVGYYTSITIGIDGLPVISYCDWINHDLKVVKCGNASCSSVNTITTVDSEGYVGSYTSITIGTDGLPVISYYSGDDGDLKVAKCGNASCSSGNTITTVDSAGSVGYYTSITIGTDGLPVISYSGGGGDLQVAKCGNASCSSGNTITTVDSEGYVDGETAITIGTDGLPVISYEDWNWGHLKIVKCGNASCSSGNTITPVDSAGAIGRFASITIGTDGLPVISYMDGMNYNLRVTKCANPFCINNWSRR